MGDNTDVREEALSIYSGPRRTYEIFSIVAKEPKTMRQIMDAVPGAEDFIRSIVRSMVDDDLLYPAADEEDTYELSEHGRAVKVALDELPDEEKAQAYEAAWGNPPPEGYNL